MTAAITIDAIDVGYRHHRPKLNHDSLKHDPAACCANLAMPRRKSLDMAANHTIDAIDVKYKHPRPKLNRDSSRQNLAVC